MARAARCPWYALLSVAAAAVVLGQVRESIRWLPPGVPVALGSEQVTVHEDGVPGVAVRH